MIGDGKEPPKTVITEFFKLHINKNKEYTFKQFKKFGIWLPSQKEIDQNIVIKMFDKFKGKVHTANETGLNGLLKI